MKINRFRHQKEVGPNRIEMVGKKRKKKMDEIKIWAHTQDKCGKINKESTTCKDNENKMS